MGVGSCTCQCDTEPVCGWRDGYVETAAGRVTRVRTRWSRRDRLGSWAVCWGIGRMRYRVPPGLFAVGAPTPDSPVCVTANYKLSFDHVRRALAGLDVWVLVLDTQGVNVWCAAGKGTFGTEELVQRLGLAGVARVVNHRTLIVPQLGAPGIAAHEVSRRTGFRVAYGPVYVRDLPAYLRAGLRATPEMRRVGFTLRERLAVTPIELVHRFIPALTLLSLFVASSGLGRRGYRLDADLCAWIALAVASNYLAGIVLTPALLPWLPGRAFAVKGAATGAALGCTFACLWPFGWLAGVSVWLLSVSACSFLGLMFTGSTPYTSASGVRSEMSWALPAQGMLAVVGLAGWLAACFV